MLFSRLRLTILLFCFCNLVHADSPWELDTGIRYWLGEGYLEFNLFDSLGEEHLSRLTYQNVTTNTAETYWQLTHDSGVFFKGYMGGGSNVNGEFIDEDFPPLTEPYSRTSSSQKYGRLNYLSFDLGYKLIDNTAYSISPFIGYHYWLTHYSSFGCTQTATNPDICSGLSFPGTVDILNDNLTWNSLRLGLDANLQLIENLNLKVDAAYIYAYLLGHDFHNLRPDIRGEFFDGTGCGVLLDATLNWLATPSLSFGLGGRLWTITTDGYSHFEETAVQGHPQYIDTTETNYGLLIQSQYRFKDSDGGGSPSHRWHGPYLGANLGYGTSFNNVSILPYTSTPEDIAALSPYRIHVQNSGFLGGGQAGYHWLKENHTLRGIEADLDYASIGGSNSITYLPGPYLMNHSVSQSVNWFGTVRGKLGKLIKNTMLPYVTAGFSYAETTLQYTQELAYTPSELPLLDTVYTSKQTMLNWLAGAGLEYAVSNHLRYKLEYLYLDLGNHEFESQYYAVGSNFGSNIIRAGINYQF